MSDLEQEQFIRFMKYQNVLMELDRAKFYELKNGSVELHKDRMGNLSAVIFHSHRSLQ